MPLTQEEQHKLEEYIKIIQENDAEMIKSLSKVPGELLLKFSEESKEFTRLCETNFKAKELWKELLKKKKYPHFDIIGLDRTTYSPFKLVLAVFLLGQFEQTGIEEFLNKACNYGLHAALIRRLGLNLNALRDLDEASTKDKKFRDQIILDCLLLSNLYGTPGNLTASEYLLAVANDYAQFTNEKAAIAHDFYLAALESLITAQFLEPQSQRLIEVIYQGKGILAGHYNKFKSWQDAINSYIQQGGINYDKFKETRLAAKEKLDKLGIDIADFEQKNNLAK